MKVSSFLIRIIFLFLPGIIGSVIYKKLKGGGIRKDWEDFIEIIIFSLISYSFYAITIDIISIKWSVPQYTFFNALLDENISISYKEILTVSLINIPLAFAASFLYTHKIINRFGQFVRVTKRYGDEDVWDLFHNIPNIEWVFVRDHKFNLIYYGWIQGFSDSKEERELLLRDVTIFDSLTGDQLGETNIVYFSRDRHEITIEVKLPE
jgi:hypothetical protein